MQTWLNNLLMWIRHSLLLLHVKLKSIRIQMMVTVLLNVEHFSASWWIAVTRSHSDRILGIPILSGWMMRGAICWSLTDCKMLLGLKLLWLLLSSILLLIAVIEVVLSFIVHLLRVGLWLGTCLLVVQLTDVLHVLLLKLPFKQLLLTEVIEFVNVTVVGWGFHIRWVLIGIWYQIV